LGTTRSRRRLVDCIVCGARRAAAADGDTSTELCATCFDEAGLENEHADTDGEHHGRAPVAGCPICRDATGGIPAPYRAAVAGRPDLAAGYSIVIEYVRDPGAVGTALYHGGIADLTMVDTCLVAFRFLHPDWPIVGVQVLAVAPGRPTALAAVAR
jgi:hypothetical protein